MKGIVLAGGTGSRLHPLTRITNKHLLPIYDRPMILYPIHSLVEAGIEEIMIVTGGPHAGDFLPLLEDGAWLGVKRLQFAYQKTPGGIAEALGLCERFVDGDNFVVILGDNILGHSINEYIVQFDYQLGGARLLFHKVENTEQLKGLGVPVLEGGKLIRVDEKPRFPASPYAVIGVYMYGPGVFGVIKGLNYSSRGELEITDVNNYYIRNSMVEYNIISGYWGDAGESIESYNDVITRVRNGVIEC